MTRDEAKKILGENATEEVITNFLNNYHIDESNKIKELQNQVNSLNEQSKKYGDYDAIKKQLDDINKANMSEQEKIEAMRKETELNLKNSRITVSRAKAKEILAGENISDEEIEDLISDDLDKTIARVNRWKALIDNIKSNTEKMTTEKLTNVDLKPTMTNVNQNENATMTFEKFADMSTEDQNKWLAENPNGLDNLN